MTTNVALEEYELLGDSKYRNFVTAVDKALKTFEYSSEWADLISALGKLNKVLLSHIKFSVIPRRITISKRLAQCLHPALPSGVHLKALETYDIIFKCIGTARLSQELFIYSAGLFPLLGNAAMNVRPVLLTIYESHFVPLGERLRPGLLGFLIGVLPGLEEGSDHFERTDSLLLSVCDGVEQSFFYGCLWRCVLTNPGVRLPAITFVLVHLDKKKSMEDQLHLIGTDIDAMVGGMCAALQDSSVLVQRCALDLLLLGFPLHNSQLVQTDRIQILESAVSVVLRRDMSLNRRLFAWLLGTDSTSCPLGEKNHSSDISHNRRSSIDDDTFETAETTGPSQISAYFNTYSKDLLLIALRNLFTDPQSSLMLLTSSGHISGFPFLWPYRILISLLDRSEIGSHILDDILVEVFRALYKEVSIKSDNNQRHYRQKRTKNNCNTNKFSTNNFENKANEFQKELVKTANLLFGTLEPSFLWDYVGRLFQKACVECEIQESQLHLLGKSRLTETVSEVVDLVGLPTIEELCKLVAFLLEVINVETYQDTPTIHLPELLATLGSLLTKYCHVLTLKEFSVTFQLCSKLLSKAQPVMYATSNALSSIHSRCKSTSSLDSNTTATSYSLSLRVDTPKSPLFDQVPKEIEEKINEGKAEHLCWISLDLSPDPQEEELEESFISNNFVLSKAVGVFQEFIAVFIHSKLLSNVEEATEAFQKNIVIVDKSLEREKELQHLLGSCLRKSNIEVLLKHTVAVKENLTLPNHGKTPLSDFSQVNDHLADAFEGACQLLIELAAFPVYLTSRRNPKMQQRTTICDVDPLPRWLKMLLTVGCLMEERQIHLCALSALLELVALTHAAISITNDSSNQSFKSFPSLSEETGDSVTCVVNIPMISETHLQYLTQRTQFFALSAAKLWSHVGHAPSEQQIKSVDLLQQVHNLAPDHPCHGSVCDVVICEELSSTDHDVQMEALKKFCVLWHLTRDIRLKSNGGTALSRLFDRPLFLVLDQLCVEPGPLKTISESWLNHCLQRGDLARVLEPLLMVLLHQDTARVSVQHVNVYCPLNSNDDNSCPKKNEDLTENEEAQIYAISSVGGNVIYHVSGANNYDSRSNSKHTSPEKKVLALTSVVGTENDKHSSKFITSHALISGYEIPCSHERNLNHPISLFVNPFGSMSSLSSGGDNPDHSSHRIVPDLTNVRRINLKTFKKGYFDTMDSEESDDAEKKSVSNTSQESDQPQSVEEFAKSILDDIITSVVESDTIVQENDGNIPKILIGEKDITETYQDKLSNSSPIIHPLHGYLLLYTQVYDSHKVLYTLSSLKAIITANPRLALWCMATTSVSQHSVTGSKGQDLQVLLARHRKSIFGNNFHGVLTSEAVTTYRSSMFVEVIVTTCLYYVRGVYPNLPRLQRWLTEDEVLGNRKVRLMALEVLTIVFTELVGIVKDGGRSVASYMSDLLNRCKVQKILLHCLTAGVYHSAQTANVSSDSSQDQVSFSKVIIDFNEEVCDGEANSFQDTLQVALLHLISKVIILEDTIGWLTATPAATPGDGRESRTSSLNSTPTSGVSTTKSTPENRNNSEKSKSNRSASALTAPFVVKYQIGVPIPAQPMFLTSILTAIKQANRCWLHSHWLSLVMATLPFTGGSGSKALSNLVVSVVSQLCLSLDSLAKKQSLLYKLEKEQGNCQVNDQVVSWPPDYLINMVESLTTICHFCLLDSPAAASAAVANAASGTSNTGAGSPAGIASHSISARTAISQLTSTSSYASGINASQIISNLLHVFSPSDILNKEFVLGPDGASGAGAALEALLGVRRTLLSNLPRIMATLTDLWRLIGETDDFTSTLQIDQEKYKKYSSLEDESRKKKHQQLLWTMGSPKVVKQHILSFLSPLSVHYGSHFMAAVSVVWHDYRPHKNRTPNLSPSSNVRRIFPVWSRQQQQLVELVKAIKVLPFESIVQTVRQVLKQPPTTAADENQKRVPLEVSLLQFFLAYTQTSTGSTLVESWPSLLVLWREGLQLSATPSGSNSSNNNGTSNTASISSPLPIIQLHLLALLHEFVQKAPMLEDKRDQKDLQEVAQKLVDVCSEIAGSSLEQTNWLRRNLAVKPGPQPDLCDDDESDTATPEKRPLSDLKASKSDFGSTGSLTNQNSNAQYSVQALQCLAEFLAPIMDVVYISEEKEKVVSLLNNIMYYVTPYLRNHSVHNTPSFRACSQLLASISGYQYTRKAWKKDAFDLLIDSSFFQMEGGECLGFWRHIIDHLMTHDKMTFRDFLARVCIPQSGSLSIFSSREQEYEQRSQLLKRLAFVIFCSELDQYQKYMPDIQERLAECLRLPQVPSVQANVFLCFRVLLLRMSPDHMTSLWPNIITEMVQVFLQMEQELSTETEQFRKLASSHIQRISLLDSSWVVHSGNGLHAHNNPAWLQLYLSVCKLLDMVICLPANMLPQFQMYRWAFVADSPPVSSSELRIKGERKIDFSLNQHVIKNLDQDFVPHIARLATLLNQRANNGIEKSFPPVVSLGKTPLLSMNIIKSLLQLQPFFNLLAYSTSASKKAAPSCANENNLSENNGTKDNCSVRDMIKLLENVMEMDFIETQSSN